MQRQRKPLHRWRGIPNLQGLLVWSPQYILARARFAGISPARRGTFRYLGATAVCPNS
jgi:hypothetical protein